MNVFYKIYIFSPPFFKVSMKSEIATDLFFCIVMYMSEINGSKKSRVVTWFYNLFLFWMGQNARKGHGF